MIMLNPCIKAVMLTWDPILEKWFEDMGLEIK